MVRALAIALLLSIALQDEDPRKASLLLRPHWNGKALNLSGTVDMPDGAYLRVITQEEVERMDHGKDECRLVVDTVVHDAWHTIEVERRKFAKDVAFPRQGFYAYSIGYARLDQVSMAVQQALGEHYPGWSRDFRAVLVEPKPLLRALVDERPTLLGFFDDLTGLAERITIELKKEEEKRNWAPIQKDISALEAKIVEFQPRTLHAATCRIAFDTLDKMRGCALKKLGFPPNSPEAMHAQEGKKDIAEGVNDEWQLELVLAYIARGRRALDRERHLLPLRYATARWHEYLAVVRAESSTGAAMDAAAAEWARAAACWRESATVVESELPDKKRRSKDEAAIAEWCEFTAGVIESLEDYARLRRESRTGSKEELEKMDADGERVALARWQSFNSALRTVPSRP